MGPGERLNLRQKPRQALWNSITSASSKEPVADMQTAKTAKIIKNVPKAGWCKCKNLTSLLIRFRRRSQNRHLHLLRHQDNPPEPRLGPGLVDHLPLRDRVQARLL